MYKKYISLGMSVKISNLIGLTFTGQGTGKAGFQSYLFVNISTIVYMEDKFSNITEKFKLVLQNIFWFFSIRTIPKHNQPFLNQFV